VELWEAGAKISASIWLCYLDEMTFRFDNRSNPYLFRETLTKLIEAPVLEYKKLTSVAVRELVYPSA
jgi:hypothetical protein